MNGKLFFFDPNENIYITETRCYVYSINTEYDSIPNEMLENALMQIISLFSFLPQPSYKCVQYIYISENVPWRNRLIMHCLYNTSDWFFIFQLNAGFQFAYKKKWISWYTPYTDVRCIFFFCFCFFSTLLLDLFSIYLCSWLCISL